MFLFKSLCLDASSFAIAFLVLSSKYFKFANILFKAFCIQLPLCPGCLEATYADLKLAVPISEPTSSVTLSTASFSNIVLLNCSV